MKNTDTASQKGYDAGKRVSGIKRHIAVDTQGLPHAVAVTTAEVTDRNGALAALDRCAGTLNHVTSVLADGGYSGKPFADAVRDKLGAGGPDRQTKPAAHLRRYAAAMGGRAIFRMAGKV